jgi:hypothetical protein
VFGKAQRVLSSLSLDDLQDYQLVKGTLLSAFEVCADVFVNVFVLFPRVIMTRLLSFLLKSKSLSIDGYSSQTSKILNFYNS